jgi:hypothetical protein
LVPGEPDQLQLQNRTIGEIQASHASKYELTCRFGGLLSGEQLQIGFVCELKFATVLHPDDVGL